jgi:hypothetical protein
VVFIKPGNAAFEIPLAAVFFIQVLPSLTKIPLQTTGGEPAYASSPLLIEKI